MAQFPGLTIWTDAWIADTMHLSWENRGIYFGLLVTMWRTPGCRVPNDDQWLASHMAMTSTEVVEKLRPIIGEFCQKDGNWLYQKRLKKEFIHRFEQHAAQSARAKHPRKKKKMSSPELAEKHAPAKPPSPSFPTPPKKASFSTSSSFPTAASEVEKTNPARSFATASNGDALAREPDSEPAEGKRSADKNPAEMTLAELNAAWRGNGKYP
jgi:uncharacterized protein YdaU (DUF1376 family)